MHIKKFPQLEQTIEWAYEYVYNKKVLPSMCSMQFGGKPIDVSPNRIFNCAYAPVDHRKVFGEMMFLLRRNQSGIFCPNHHVEKLPIIQKPSGKELVVFLLEIQSKVGLIL